MLNWNVVWRWLWK